MCPRASATPSCGHFSMQHHAVPEPQDTSSQKYGVMLGQCALPPRHVQQSHPATAGLHELPSQHRSRSSPKFSSGSSSNQGHASSAYLYRGMIPGGTAHTRCVGGLISCLPERTPNLKVRPLAACHDGYRAVILYATFLYARRPGSETRLACRSVTRLGQGGLPVSREKRAH